MGCGCLNFLVKYILFVVNLLTTVFGVLIIAFGVVLFLNLSSLDDESDEVISVARSVIIGVFVIGGVVTVISFSGCCGAITETKWLLILYSILMLILACFKIYMAVRIYKARDDVEAIVREYIHSAFERTNLATFHLLELTFQCCGVTGPESYIGVLDTLPASCCQDVASGQWTSAVCTVDDAYGGCLHIVTAYVNSISENGGKMIIGVIVVELVGAALGIWQTCAISRRNKAKQIA